MNQILGPRRAGATQDEVRRHNLSTLLRAVHENGSLTRAELTARMGLSRSTIKGLVTELVQLGVVSEQRPPRSPGAAAGRPSLEVSPRTDTFQVVAADVGVDRVDAALVALGGQVVARRHRLTGTDRPTVQRVVDSLKSIIDELLDDPAVAPAVLAVGVSIPGVTRQSDGLVRFAPNLGWVDEPLGARLTRALAPTPVRVGNDADLGALAEHRRGAARGVDDVLFIAGEIGVGAGLILGGQSVPGAGGYAGEVGHLVIRPHGRRCRCGARGCWETEIGGRAIGRALGIEHASSDELIPAMREVRARGSHELDQAGRYLGIGLASIVNLLNPRVIILGGLLRELFQATADVTQASLDAAALPAAVGEVRLVVPELGGDAVLIGAAEMAWEDVLADPVSLHRGELALPTA